MKRRMNNPTDITNEVFVPRQLRVPRVLAWRIRLERTVRNLNQDDWVGLFSGVLGTIAVILIVSGKL